MSSTSAAGPICGARSCSALRDPAHLASAGSDIATHWLSYDSDISIPRHGNLCTPALEDLQTNIRQASEARLYTFSQATKDKLRKFRLSTSRAKDPQAVICTPTSLSVYNLDTQIYALDPGEMTRRIPPSS